MRELLFDSLTHRTFALHGYFTSYHKINKFSINIYYYVDCEYNNIYKVFALNKTECWLSFFAVTEGNIIYKTNTMTQLHMANRKQIQCMILFYLFSS